MQSEITFSTELIGLCITFRQEQIGLIKSINRTQLDFSLRTVARLWTDVTVHLYGMQALALATLALRLRDTR